MAAGRYHQTGLTLLELLISVAILTLLTGLLLPSVLQARSAARRTACQSNLRQWGLAVQMYADIHHGRLPYRGQGIQPTTQLARPDDWFNALPPLIEETPYVELDARSNQPQAGASSVWICAEAEPIEPVFRKTFFAYGMNMALSTPFNGRPDDYDKVGPTQTMAFMADGLGLHCAVIPHREMFSPLARHVGETVNIAFLDGRVAAYLGGEVGCGTGDPQRPDIRWKPPGSRWPGPD
jgi:prepilin-type processing-associated H-X9-DG protein